MYQIQITNSEGKVLFNFGLEAQTEAEALSFFREQELEAVTQNLTMRLLTAEGREIEKREFRAG